jgi:hypothetical protein
MSSIADIDQRSGWPEELCALLREYPRESWRRNMTPMAQFWIDKHNDFRSQCATLKTAADDFRQKSDDAATFASYVVPRTRLLLSLLHGHHQVEDFHYFPAFRAADHRLGPGFDTLAKDHELLHESGLTLVEALNGFVESIRGEMSSDELRRAADTYIEACNLLCSRVVRHLDDEEDLVIPLMLAHK